MNLYSFKKEHARLPRLHDKYICILNQLCSSSLTAIVSSVPSAAGLLLFLGLGVLFVLFIALLSLSQTVFILPLSLSTLKGIYTVLFEEGLYNLQYLDFLRGYH